MTRKRTKHLIPMIPGVNGQFIPPEVRAELIEKSMTQPAQLSKAPLAIFKPVQDYEDIMLAGGPLIEPTPMRVKPGAKNIALPMYNKKLGRQLGRAIYTRWGESSMFLFNYKEDERGRIQNGE